MRALRLALKNVDCTSSTARISGLSPFASLGNTFGKIGAKIGILGQGFSSASVWR